MTREHRIPLADTQAGIIARRQLRSLGITANRVRNQCAAGRWSLRSERVISTFTGPLLPAHRQWLGVLHAGGDALVAGLSAAERHGLEGWTRPEVTVLIDDHLDITPVAGINYVRTRRSLPTLREPRMSLPTCRIEPAVLLFAGYTRSLRTALGLLAAVVQQGLTTPAALLRWVDELAPLRRAPHFRMALADIEGGSGSLAELDVLTMCRTFGLPEPRRQRLRRDASGRPRYTDCEWDLPTGHTVILEVDGGFHMDARHWEADMRRERSLAGPGRTLLRCTTRELRDSPDIIARDLRAAGVGHLLLHVS